MAQISQGGGGIPKARPPKPAALPKHFTLTTPHDVGTTARPPRRGHAPTVFQEPLTRTPTQRIVSEQRRHLARGVLHAFGAAPNRPLKTQEVDRVLAAPETKDLLKSTLPYLPKDHPHHSLIHNIIHIVGHVASEIPAALTQRGSSNPGLPHETVFSQKQADQADKAIQKGLNQLNNIPAALTVRGNPRLPGTSPLTSPVKSAEKTVGKALRSAQKTANQYNTESLGPGSGKVNPTVAKILKAGGRDAVNLWANAIQSGYLTVTHPREVAKSTLDQLKHPVRAFEQHPVDTLLIARGLEAGLSRGAGAVARSGVLGKGAKEFASLERKPLKLVGNATVQRRPSKGLIENRIQKAADAVAVKRGRGTTVRVPHHDEQGNLKLVTKEPAIQATERQMLKPGVGRPQAGFLNRRVDQEVGTNSGMLRIRRAKVLKAMHEARGAIRGHEDAVPLVMEGVIKRGDLKTTGKIQQALEAERQRLIDHAPTEPADAKLNAESVAAIDKLLADKEFLAKPHHVFDAAEQIVRAQRVLDAQRAKFGDFPLDAAQRRVVLPFAERELGWKYVEADQRQDPAIKRAEALRTAENQAAQAVRGAQAALQRAKQDEAAATARAETQAAGRRRAIRAGRLPKKTRLGQQSVSPTRIETPDLTRVQGERLMRAQSRRVQAEQDLQRAKLTHDRVSAMSMEAAAEAKRLGPAFVGPSGEFHSTEEALRQFEAAGGNRNDLGYVGRYKDLNAPARFRGGTGGQLRRPGQSQRYTGADTLSGAYARNYAAVAEHMAHSAARVERHLGMNDLVNLFGHKAQVGHYFDSLSAAQREARNLRDAGMGDYVAVNVARKSAPDSLMEELQPAEFEQNFHKAGQTDSHIVLFPRAVWERVNKHENLRNTVTPEFQTALQYFRHAVLPTSPRWLAGNVLESLLRTAINDPTVIRSMVAGGKLQKDVAALGPKGIRAVERLQAGAASGHFGSQKYLDYFRPEDERNILGILHGVRNAPVAKQVGNMWDAYRVTVTSLNERLESSVYFGGLGKELRDEIHSFTNDWLKTVRLGGPAYQDAVRGMLDSNNVARYVAAVDKMRGRYTNLSPRGRSYVTQYVPFAPWLVNAIHFMAVTMPAHHPVLTAVQAGLNMGTEKDRHGLQLPPWLEGSIPFGNKAINVNRFTPFGALTHGPNESPVLSNLEGYVVPQILPALINFAGHDWTLKEFPKGTTAGEAFMTGMNTLATTFIPFASAVQRFREHGGTAQPTSTILSPKIKAGTGVGALATAGKTFLPGFPQNVTARSFTSPSHIKSSGGNRFLNGGGTNRFLQPGAGGNRFLQGG